MEKMLLDNVAAAPGSSGNARTTAGFPAWLRTNADRGAGTPAGADPTLSGTTAGYPDGAATDAATTRSLTETLVNDTIQLVWTEGGEPKYMLVSPTQKRAISTTFNGYATKYKDADDKKIISAVDD